KGQFYGGFEVQLNEAFLNDTMAYRLHYVVPARIIESSLDSVLSGNSFDPNPDPRIPAEWVTAPKNYTLFGIKFINPYHGKYLHRGQSVVKDNGGTVLETLTYRQKYVE